MIDESSLPHRGDEIDGYRASVSSGLSPRFWRYHLHDTHWRSAYVFLFIVTPLGLLPIWLGSKLLGAHRIKTMLLGVALCGVGGLMILLGPILALGMVWMARKWARHFRHGLLIPGVVVSSKPLAVVGLADMGKDPEKKGREFALARADLWSLPGHSREVGTRVPCVADFSNESRGRFLYFSPYPIAHGTGDAFDLEQCMQRIGEAPFRRLEALVARGLAPEHWNRIVVVDAQDEEIETRGYMQVEEICRDEKKQDASQAEG